MLKSYKGRKIKIGQEVEVYRNLHNNLFSIRDAKSGLVIAHGEDFTIKNAVVKVSDKGRERVKEEKRKNVHAFIKGEIVVCDTIVLKNEITYNPYTHESFVFKKNGQTFMGGKLVYFNNSKCYLVEELKNVKVQVMENDN